MSGINTNNVFHACGRLGNEPNVNILPSGRKIISFNIAVDRSWVDREGTKCKKTNWFKCVAFHPLSRYVESCHIHKGCKVSIVGSIENESYTTQTGEVRASYSVWLSGFEKQSDAKKSGDQSEQQNQQAEAQYTPEAEGEYLPF